MGKKTDRGTKNGAWESLWRRGNFYLSVDGVDPTELKINIHHFADISKYLVLGLTNRILLSPDLLKWVAAALGSNLRLMKSARSFSFVPIFLFNADF